MIGVLHAVLSPLVSRETVRVDKTPIGLSRLHDKTRKYRKAQAPQRAFEDANENDGLEMRGIHLMIRLYIQI